MTRFSHALDEADDLNEHLSDLVSEKTQQLEDNYKKLRRIEKNVVVSEERKRIMRDMHDGLGGQLVHALALSEQGTDEDLQKALRYAMDDLRLVVDSLSPDDSSLFELLANYRHRVSQLTKRIDVDIAWQIDESVAKLDLGPKKALNILRILQEGVTNAIRHANCQKIQVSFTEVDGDVVLCIADD